MSRAAVIALAVFVASALAMYEDEIGRNDWHTKNVGLVRHAAVTGRRTLVASTTALAALNTKTGEILWRQVAPTGELIDQVYFGKRLVS
eukprot:m51a1_g14210 putative er membrane protein complex subunit 1-like (89) ;mRNA; r:163938-164506